jgi:AraC-like DNA-binding protein
MKEVVHEFGIETHWVAPMAKAMGGDVKGNHIIVPPEMHTGTRYILPISPDITVMLADVTYHQDVQFKLRNVKDDFIGIYFNLTEGDSTHLFEQGSQSIGRWNYNLAIVECHVDLDYVVKAGTKTYNICIFIKKAVLKEYLFRSGHLRKLLDRVFDPKQNTILHYNIMSNTSLQFIDEFRKRQSNPLCFDLFLSATVHNLLGDYLDELAKKDLIISKLDNTDFTSIIASQELLISKLKDSFPGINTLAENAFMSETKFKKLYKKITGLTPYEFYMNNKIELAQDLLISGNYNIGEIADELKFPTASNLTQLFKNYFGVLPKDYLAQI